MGGDLHRDRHEAAIVTLGVALDQGFELLSGGHGGKPADLLSVILGCIPHWIDADERPQTARNGGVSIAVLRPVVTEPSGESALPPQALEDCHCKDSSPLATGESHITHG